MSEPERAAPGPWRDELCGVVVAFHPDDDFADNLRAIAAECGRVLVMDNGTGAETRARLAREPDVDWIVLGTNEGVATALNRGAERALALGFRWMVTFDQDSRPQPGMIAALWTVHRAQPNAALVGPRIHEAGSSAARYRWLQPHPGWSVLFRLNPQPAVESRVTTIITSGALTELGSWRALGGFDDALFIDYVDTEFCLRTIRSGRSIAVASAALLNHRLGAQEVRRLAGRDFRPTHHRPFRHYYMARNRVRAWRRHAWAVPHWAVFDFCFMLYNGFRILAFEAQKVSKLKAIFLGTWDGWRGRFGPCPATRVRQFET